MMGCSAVIGSVAGPCRASQSWCSSVVGPVLLRSKGQNLGRHE